MSVLVSVTCKYDLYWAQEHKDSVAHRHLTEYLTVFVSAASKLSIVLTHKQLIDELALCLDRDTRSISNWKDLAWEMKVDKKVIKKLEQYSDFSPTIRLFTHLEVTQPDLDIERLRNALLEIKRHDLFSLLTTEGNHHVWRSNVL